MKVIVVSFFPDETTAGNIGGFDWYPDTVTGLEQARTHVQLMLGDWQMCTMPPIGVTIRRLNVPVDPTIHGWRDAVTQWLDENRELCELPFQIEVADD